MAKRKRNITDKIQSKMIAHQIDLMRFSESVREKIVSLLYSLSTELQRQLYEYDIAGEKPSRRQSRAEGLIRQTKATIATAFDKSENSLSGELLSLADFESAAAVKLLNDVVGVSFFDNVFTKADLVRLVDDSMFLGLPQAQLWKNQTESLQQKFAQQIRLGVLAGETNDQLIGRIRGAKTGRKLVLNLGNGKTRTVNEYSQGIMNVSYTHATALVRTAVQTISNLVLADTYEANQDVIKGMLWLSVLDNRTSVQCRALDHGAWGFDGKPLPESRIQILMPSLPPIHVNCRSVVIPILKSWEELTGIEGLEEFPESTRSSMDGQVSDKLNYEDWLNQQPVYVQKDVLGNRFDLWKGGDGNLSLSQMIDQSGRPLTLTELRAKG